MSTRKPTGVLSMGAVAVAAATLGFVLSGGLNATPSAQADPAPATTAQAAAAPAGYPDFADLAAHVIPSVISVYTTEVVDESDMRQFHRNVDPFEFFFGPRNQQMQPRQQRRQGAGSGFFIDASGLALTNNHVVEGADTIRVQLADDTQLDAKVVGRDPATDVALIQVEGKGPFTPLPLGDSSKVRVGEWVMAVGNPLRMDHTVTVGVVSAKHRSLGLSDETRSFENFIQTDAAINLGNSGGPLVNLQGQAIGINTAINAAGQNLGFAIPINTAKAILDQLKTKGRVVRGYLGVIITDVTEDLQKGFNLPSREGALVQEVEEGGPAAKAGVENGDAIVAVDGSPIKDTRGLIDHVSSMPPGQKVRLEVLRNGEKKSLTVTLGERPAASAEQQQSESTESTPAGKIGLTVEDLTARNRRMLNLPPNVNGVVVTDVTALSPAEDAGIAQGDIIEELNGRSVSSVDDLEQILDSVRSGSYLRLYIYRPQIDRGSFFIVQMP